MKDKEKQIEICENCKIKENCSHRILTHMEKCKVDDCDCFQNIFTDKEKHIEEMAKEMCGNDCEECARESAEFYKQTIEEARNNHCLLKNCAKTLYEQGYRKLPKDSVVLSNEEYGELKGRAEEVFNEMTERMKAEVKIAKKMGVVKGSKETAEKFAKGLIKIIKEKDTYLDWDDVLEFAKEQFDVEIKE